MTRLVRFGWFVIGWNVVTILLGALVRATHSGAGCGRSWPTCQGELLPELSGATTIEFTHRIASGIALVLVAALVAVVWRSAGRGQPARRAALWAGVAIVGEALIGAAIVFYEWVADDRSIARVVAVPLHLVNTFLLLAALTLTAWFLGGGGRLVARGGPFRWMLAGGAALVAIAGTGAVTALADTLFPSESVASGLAAAITSTEHFLTRLRVIHPAMAVLTVSAAAFATRLLRGPVLARVRTLLILSLMQMGLGVLTIALASPLWVRLLHLATADLIWISYVWLAAQTLSSKVDSDSGVSTGARQAKPVHR
ncbi:MAG TPA: COX15/CtaA family protein [Acidimicrobiia bacterium]|nr:COX15/CtaA family protein [Acidimicrobiia bacterium]